MPTLRQLRYLVAIAETGSFRRAAELCHVSQPALSEQIRALEDRLRVQLVERNRRRVLLTAVGAEITERARRVLRDVEDIRGLAERGRHGLEGTVRCGVLPSLGPYLLPLILPGLHRRYPRLTLYLREDNGDALLARLQEGDLDLLLTTLPVPATGFSASPLFREPLWLAVARDHPLAGREAIDPADLRDLPVLALEARHSLHDQVEALCRACAARPLYDFATTSLDTLRQMAGMGVGAAFLPALYVRAEAWQDEQIVVRPFRPPPPSRRIGLVWRALSARAAGYAGIAEEVRTALAATVEQVTVEAEPTVAPQLAQ